jgi:putative ABC transport system permease protein
LLLLRFPSVLAAVLVASIILAVAAASGRLFLSSAGSAAVDERLSTLLPEQAGYRIASYGDLALPVFRQRSEALLARMGAVPQLGSPVVTVIGPVATVRRAGGGPGNPIEGQPQFNFANRPAGSARLATRTGYLDHIRVLRDVEEPGVWIANTTARSQRIDPGDRIIVEAIGGRTVVRVKGIYRSFAISDTPQGRRQQAGAPLDPYWAAIQDYVRATGFGPPPPPLMLADREVAVRVGHGLARTGFYQWEFPLVDRDLTLPQAEHLAVRLEALQADIDDPDTPVGAALPLATEVTSLPGAVALASRTVNELAGAVSTLGLAGVIVALVVLGSAGLYGVQRRRTEMAMLSSRGVSPVALGARTGVEALVPAVIGGALGFGSAIMLARALGPSDRLDPAAVGGAAFSVAFVVLAGIVILAIVAALSGQVKRDAGLGRARHLASRTPWEAVALALAAASFYELATRGGPVVETAEGTRHVDVFLLLFPLLFVAGATGLAARALQRILPRLRAAGRWSRSLYLASRRLAGASTSAMLLVTAAALSVGILGYAGVLVASIRASAEAKALVFTGTDVSVVLPPKPVLPEKLPFPATEVARLGGPSSLLPTRAPVEVMAIDPSTFDRVVYWDESFAERPLEELLSALSSTDGRRLSVLLAGASVPAHPTLEVESFRIPLEVVGNARAFPGLTSGRPLLVVDVAALEKVLEEAGTSLLGVTHTNLLWARGESVEVLSGMRALGVPIQDQITAVAVQRSPEFLALSWTFGLLQALGVSAGLVALVGMVLYVQARQHGRVVSYVLTRRMGLSRRAHVLSLALELGGLMAAALALGLLAGLGAAWLVRARLDPLPQVPPELSLLVPFEQLGIVVVVVLASAWIGAWWVQRSAERAQLGEVMRLAG